MALIDLSQLKQLKQQASLQNAFVDTHCYNSEGKTKTLPDDLFIYAIKAHRQAKNLTRQLTKLHTICTDYVAGNFQSYIDAHLAWDEEDAPFEPINELLCCFTIGTIHDLPQTIGQYAELLALTRRFSEIRQKQRLGFQQSFPTLQAHYPAIGQDGETILIPESELPEDVLNTIAANKEIAEIEVEYSLDGYDEFYRQVMSLINTHKSGDVVECAKSILSLFAKSKTSH